MPSINRLLFAADEAVEPPVALLPVSDGREPSPMEAGLEATPNLLALQRYCTWPLLS